MRNSLLQKIWLKKNAQESQNRRSDPDCLTPIVLVSTRAIRPTFGVLQITVRTEEGTMSDKDDAYLTRLWIKLTVGFTLVVLGTGITLFFFPGADLRIVLLPLWVVGFFLILKYVYYFIKSFFSN